MEKNPKGLTPKEKEKLVRIAWKQIEGFIRDWQRSPHEWNNERDIQVDIASRIKSAYRGYGQDRIWAKYPDKHYVERFHRMGIYLSRVMCEPPVYYRHKNGKHETYKPDIVVWDDIPHPEEPNKDNYQKKRNDPMLLLCEIKYRPPWSKAYNPPEKDTHDLLKLKNLLRQNKEKEKGKDRDGTRYACWLNIAYKVDQYSKNKFDNRPHVEGGLRKYYVTLPGDIKKSQE